MSGEPERSLGSLVWPHLAADPGVPSLSPSTLQRKVGETDSDSKLDAIEDALSFDIQRGLSLLYSSADGSVITLTPASPTRRYGQDDGFGQPLPHRTPESSVPLEVEPGRGLEPCTLRLSLSNVSLQTCRPSEDCATTHQCAVQPTIEGSSTLTQNACATVRSWMGSVGRIGEAEQSRITEHSFFTARGTLRSVLAGQEGQIGHDSCQEREVIVDVVSQGDVERWTIRSPHGPLFGFSRLSQAASDDSSPLPSRLHLVHPASTVSPVNALQMMTTLTASFHPTNPLAILTSLAQAHPADMILSAQSQARLAFWRIVSPALSELAGWRGHLSKLVEDVSGYLPDLVGSPGAVQYRASGTPRLGEERTHRPHLYSEETIYTLRLPMLEETKEGARGQQGSEPGAGERIDLGPTARPVFVRKRAALPVWQAAERDEKDWGRGLAMELGGGTGVHWR